jgi:hypothetical protein
MAPKPLSEREEESSSSKEEIPSKAPLIIRGSGGKITIFEMNHMSKISTQIHSSIPQYNIYKILLGNI